jgi:hypothetical protein
MVLRLVPAAAGSATRDIATLEGTAGRGYSDVAPGRTVVLRIHWVPDLGPERVLAESDPVRAPWESADDLGGSDSMRSTGHALRPVAVDGPRSTAPWTSEEGS